MLSKPSNTVKDRWNAAHYTQVKASVDPEIATAFKAACAANGTSMAAALSILMAGYSQAAANKPPDAEAFATRRKRRHAVACIVTQLEKLMLAEENFRDNVPENLQGSKWHEASENSIELMQDVINLLGDIYS